VAWRYLLAVDGAIEKLATQPGLGWARSFKHPELQHLRSFLVTKPFHRHLVFYRHDHETLDAVRVMHGARDLEQRLREPAAPRESQS